MTTLERVQVPPTGGFTAAQLLPPLSVGLIACGVLVGALTVGRVIFERHRHVTVEGPPTVVIAGLSLLAIAAGASGFLVGGAL